MDRPAVGASGRAHSQPVVGSMSELIEDENRPLTKQEIYSRLHANQEPMVSKSQAETNLRGVALCRKALGLLPARRSL